MEKHNWNKVNYIQHNVTKKNGVIVFIHGFASDSSIQSNLIEYIHNYDYYCIDLPGNGISAKHQDYPLNIEGLAQCVIEWLEYLELSNVILIGHSMGGAIASSVASKIPNIIKKLILVMPMHSTANNIHDVFNFITKFIPVFNWQTYAMCNDLLKDTKHFYASKHDPLIIEKTKFSRAHYRDFAILRRHMLKFKTFKLLKLNEKKIKCQTLLITGSYDRIINNVKAQKNIKENIEHLTIINYDNCAHMPMIENPKQYYKDILNFIELEN